MANRKARGGKISVPIEELNGWGTRSVCGRETPFRFRSWEASSNLWIPSEQCLSENSCIFMWTMGFHPQEPCLRPIVHCVCYYIKHLSCCWWKGYQSIIYYETRSLCLRNLSSSATLSLNWAPGSHRLYNCQLIPEHLLGLQNTLQWSLEPTRHGERWAALPIGLETIRCLRMSIDICQSLIYQGRLEPQARRYDEPSMVIWRIRRIYASTSNMRNVEDHAQDKPSLNTTCGTTVSSLTNCVVIRIVNGISMARTTIRVCKVVDIGRHRVKLLFWETRRISIPWFVTAKHCLPCFPSDVIWYPFVLFSLSQF